MGQYKHPEFFVLKRQHILTSVYFTDSMVLRGRGRARGRANNATMAVNQRFRELERRLTGHKTVPALNPPAFVQLPWNSWTFERLETTTANLQGINITVSDILAQIRSRVLLDANADIRIKVQSAQIWCTASTLVYPDLEATFYELVGESTSTNQYPRSTQRDKGTLNMPARCVYMYPSADKREIVGTPEAGLIVSTGVATASGSEITFRVQVLWQANA